MQRHLRSVLITIVLAGLSYDASAQQKIVFCAESISYNGKMGASSCKTFCNKHTEAPECTEEGRKDWKIDAVSPKEAPESIGDMHCSCIGQQYVLSKVKASVPATSSLDGRELSLLRRENAVLQKENNRLKAELDALKKR